MAQAVNDSPYALSLPRPYDQVQNGLGYSRHYAQRIKDMGKDSKDSWIKKLWTHMFQGKHRDRGRLRDHESISRSRSRLYGNLSGRESTTSNHSIRNAHSDTEQSSPMRKSKSNLSAVKHKSSTDGKSKDKSKGKSNTPNLPPISSKSVVTQSQETRPVLLTPAKSALQPTSVTTLYDSDKDESEDEETPPKKTESPSRSRKPPEPKKLSFFERMALASSQSKQKPPRDVSPKKSEEMLKSESLKPTSHPRTTKAMRDSGDNKQNGGSGESAEFSTVRSELQKIRAQRIAAQKNQNNNRDTTERSARDTTRSTHNANSNKHAASSKVERKLRKLHESYDGNRYLRPEMGRKGHHPFFGSHSIEKSGGDGERRLSKRDPQTMEMEKRAKAIVDKATKVTRIFFLYKLFFFIMTLWIVSFRKIKCSAAKRRIRLTCTFDWVCESEAGWRSSHKKPLHRAVERAPTTQLQSMQKRKKVIDR